MRLIYISLLMATLAAAGHHGILAATAAAHANEAAREDDAVEERTQLGLDEGG